jgi:hypothetical protein
MKTMSDIKKADKISVEELHFIETLKKEFNMLNLKVENTKLQYENALFKIMRKYGLSESDSIDETTGSIVRRPPPAPPMAVPPPAPPLPPAPPPPVVESEPEPAVEPVVVGKSKKGKSSK